MTWKPGDRLRHRFNPDLGPGLVPPALVPGLSLASGVISFG